MKQNQILEEAVKESGKSITQICKEVGITTQTYRNFVKKGLGLSVSHLEKFAEVLGKDIVWIESVK